MLSEQNILTQLSALDWIVFSSVLVLTLVSVIWVKFKNISENSMDNPVEMLLMGRRLTLPLFIITLVASWYGGIFGVTSLTYDRGLYNLLTQGIFWYLIYLVFAFFLIYKIRSYEALSLSDIAKKTVGVKAAKLVGVLNFFNLLPIAYAISLGLFLKLIFTIPLAWGIFIGLFFMGFYSLWGGLKAVIYTDVVQFFFMIASVLVVLLFSILKYGSPLDVLSKLPPSHLDWTGGESFPQVFIWFFIAASTLVDPYFYQRCLAAKDDKTARNGVIISTFIWIIFDLMTTLGTLYARVHFPTQDSSRVYLDYGLFLLPSGLRGLLLGGILAIIISTLDAYLFNAASCLSYDLIQDKFNQRKHQLCLIFVCVLTFILSCFFDSKIVEVWKLVGSLSAACLLFPILIAQLLPQKIPENWFILSVSLAGLGIVSWRFVKNLTPYSMFDEFYLGLIISFLTLFMSFLVKKFKA